MNSELRSRATRLLALEARAGQGGLLRAPADRIAERDTDRPRRIVGDEQLPQHVAERPEILADDGTGEAAGADQFGAAEAVRQIRAPARARPAASAFFASASAVSVFSICRFVRCRSVRMLSALRTAASTSGAGPIGGTRSAVSSRTDQKSGALRIDDENPQLILRLADLRLRDDQALAPLRDFGPRRHEIERRRLPDVNARPVVALQLLRQLERSLLDRDRGPASTRFQ